MVQSVDQLLEQNGIKCVVYGGAGLGKTRLILTCPRPIVISAEKGLLSLRGSNVPVWGEISTLQQLIDAYQWCVNSREASAFDTIALDGLSELADNILQTVKSQTKDGRKAHNDAYELVVFRIMNALRDLPRKHVYITCKERYAEDQITKTKQFMPSMPNGNLIREVPYKFDYMFRLFPFVDAATQMQSLWLQTAADTTAVAKDRSGTLAKYEQPHLGNMFAKAMSRG